MDCTDSIDVSLSREKRKKQITHFYTLEKKKNKKYTKHQLAHEWPPQSK